MIVGIDPGIDGAAAALSSARSFMDVINLPTIGEGKKREIDACGFMEWLVKMSPNRIVIENVHSMPRDGVSSAFKFGAAFGALKAAARLYIGHRLELVEPQVWKAYFDLPSDKEAARQKALKMFFEMEKHLTRKLDHQRAEAMLIAWWADCPPVGKNHW